MQEEDLNDELASHLEFQIRKYIAQGMSESEARRGGAHPIWRARSREAAMPGC